MKSYPTIRDLFPNLSSQELKEAEENLDKYLLLVLSIFERIGSQNDSELRKKFDSCRG